VVVKNVTIICANINAGLQNPAELENNAKGIGRSKITPHEGIRAGAGEKVNHAIQMIPIQKHYKMVIEELNLN